MTIIDTVVFKTTIDVNGVYIILFERNVESKHDILNYAM